MNNQIEKLLTLEDVAEILGCTPRYVREVCIRKRGLPAVRIYSKSLRIDPQELREWIAKAERGMV